MGTKTADKKQEADPAAQYVKELHFLNVKYEFIEEGVYSSFLRRHPAMPARSIEEIRDSDAEHMELVTGINRRLEKQVQDLGLENQKVLSEIFAIVNNALEAQDGIHFDFVRKAMLDGRTIGQISSNQNDYKRQCMDLIPLYVAGYAEELSKLNGSFGLHELNAIMSHTDATQPANGAGNLQ